MVCLTVKFGESAGMRTSNNRPYLVVAVLMAATSAAIYFFGDVSKIATNDVGIDLPAAVGTYEGKDVRYCSSETCGKAFVVKPDAEMQLCPVCHAPLDVMSPVERAILPAGTLVMKKAYTSPQNEPMFVSVVVSGTDRLGIHRPQNCLPGQGFVIRETERMPVRIPGREDLLVTLLELGREAEMPDRAGNPPRLSCMAYWYFAGGRETPYQSSMMFWMAYDRVLRGKAERWAYVSIMTGRRENSDDHKVELAGFISKLHPLMKKTTSLR
jgi:hypothetical protein